MEDVVCGHCYLPVQLRIATAYQIDYINATLQNPGDDIPQLSISVGVAFSRQGTACYGRKNELLIVKAETEIEIPIDRLNAVQ